MLRTLGRSAHDHRVAVVGVWVAALALFGGVSGALGSGFASEFSLPDDVESQQGFDVIDEGFGGRGAGQTASIVFEATQGVEDPAVVAAMTDYLAEVDALADVSVTSPYEPAGGAQIARQGPRAGEVAYAQIEVPRHMSFEETIELGNEMRDLVPDVDGLRVEVGGQVFSEFEPPESEVLGLAFAIVILIVSFGSVLAMGLPIGTAVFGIGVGASLVTLMSRVIEMPDFTLTLGVMIGLGVGIDYALFIVTRFREELHAGRPVPDAVATSIDTAGRAVIFAGTTVVISLLGMVLMGVTFIRGLGIGAAVTVAITMAASITLLPALMGFAGARIEVSRWRGVIAAGLVSLTLVGVGLGVDALLLALPAAVVVLVAGLFVAPLRAEVPRRAPKPLDQTLPYRWSRFVQAHPWPMVIGGTAVLAALAIPVLGLRLGFADEGNLSTDTSARQAYDLLAEGFGPGYNGPLIVAAELAPGTTPAELERVGAALAADEGVAAVSPVAPNAPDAATAALWQVVPATSPQDEATYGLVERLRDDVLVSATDGTGITATVTGSVAASVDFASYLGDRLPLFFAAVLTLSFLLLMAVFRSVLVPLKAVLMNLISIGAAYGVVVAVFQWGWGSSLLGIEAAPVEPFLPMMLFAIVFGLSMDYEVFLLSRVKEEYDRDGDNARAVSDGLASTARVITAAAAIMVFIFSSFVLEDDRVIKMFGLGLAAAIALDATIVRMLLVPATMELLGDRNWWLPRWLDRILPGIDVEGSSSRPTPPAADEPDRVPVA